MDPDLQSVLLSLVKTFRIQQEHLLKLEAAVRVLLLAFAESTHSDPETLLRDFSSIEDQIRDAHPTRAAREQIDYVVRLLEGKPGDPPLDS